MKAREGIILGGLATVGIGGLIGNKLSPASRKLGGHRYGVNFSEEEGGARITDQTRSSSEFDRGGRQVPTQGGADEQGPRWKFWDNDDDDSDSTGSAPNESVSRHFGGVDSDFDAYVALGLIGFFMVVGITLAIVRSSKNSQVVV